MAAADRRVPVLQSVPLYVTVRLNVRVSPAAGVRQVPRPPQSVHEAEPSEPLQPTDGQCAQKLPAGTADAETSLMLLASLQLSPA